MEGIFLDELRATSSSLISLPNTRPRQAILFSKGHIYLLKTRIKEIQKIKQEMDRTLRMSLDGALSSQQFKALYQPLGARKNQIEEEMPKIEGELDLLRIDGLLTE